MNAPRFLKSLERAQDRWELAKARGMMFRYALARGEIPPPKSPTYESWVRQQRCAACGHPGPSEVSHLADEPWKAWGSKVPFTLVWPSCRECHLVYHENREGFAANAGDPLVLIAMTLTQAVIEGVLVVRSPT